MAVTSQTDLSHLETMIGEGYTLLVRHAERHDDRLLGLARLFSATFHAPIDLHLYATPPQQYGFSWHYDPEDVFILQMQGEKQYALRKNTVHPWPVMGGIPEDMHYEREIMPLIRVTLRAGDLLYIPCGYWHRGTTPAGQDVAISISIGVTSRTVLDLLDQIRPQLLASLVCRQRLPLAASSHDDIERSRTMLETTYRHLLEQLSRELAGILQDESLLLQLTQQSLVATI